MRARVAALLFVLTVAGCGSSEPAPAPADGAAPVATPATTVATTFVEEGGTVLLADALDQVARSGGVNVVLDPGVSFTAPVEADVRRRANASGSARAALDVIAASAGCEVDERHAGLFVISNHSRVDVAIAGLPARSALRLIAAFGGRSLVMSRSVPDEPLDLTLDGVRWRVALEQVVASLGPFEVVEEGDLLRVQPRADAGPQKNHDATDPGLTLSAGAIVSATATEVQLQPDKAGEPALTLRVPADESAHARRLRSVLANVDERAPRLAFTADGGRTITNAVVRAGKGAPR
jgi:hypothetical protein